MLNRVQGAPAPLVPHGNSNYGAVSPDDRLFVTVSSWDTAGYVYRVGKCRQLLALPDPIGIANVAFNGDGTLLATISNDAVRLWDTREQSPALTLAGQFR